MSSKSYLQFKGREVVWAGTQQEAKDLLDVIPLAEAAAEQALGIKNARTPVQEPLPIKPVKKVYGSIFEACFIAYLLAVYAMKLESMWHMILPALWLGIAGLRFYERIFRKQDRENG